MHRHHRRIGETHGVVVREVGLLDGAAGQGDLAVERGRQAVDDAALHLHADDRGIDHRAAIDGAGHTLDLQRLAVGHGDLGDLRHDRAERGAQRNAAARSRRQGLAPARFPGGGFQHLEMPWLVGQQLAAEIERVLLQGQRQLVDKTLVEEGGVRMADRAPEAHRHRAVGDHGLQPVERKRVGRILDGIALGLALRRQAGGARAKLVARRLRDLALGDAREFGCSLRHIEFGPPPRQRHRPVVIVADVLFARPQHLDGPFGHGEGAGHGLAHQIDLGAPTEAAAQESRVHGDVGLPHVGGAGRGQPHQGRRLVGHPDVDAGLAATRAVQFIGSIGVCARYGAR